MAIANFARKPAIQQVFLTLLVIALLLPFINKAYHIDDPVYIWIAKQILQHPFDFFGFSVNWFGTTQDMAWVSVSPPLFSYYLALFGGLFGWSEPVMHSAQLFPAVAVVLGTYQLANQLRVNPLLASLLTAVTPIFLLCGTSVMMDMSMTAFYVWALYFWLKGLDTGQENIMPLLMAALLIVAAGLTKYFAISLLPLMALSPLWRRLPLRRWLFFLLSPLIVFAIYQYWTKQLYGFGHISHASEFAAAYRGKIHSNVGKSSLETLSFLGGGLLIPIFFAPLIVRKTGWLIAAGSLAGAAFLLWLMNSSYQEGLLHSWSGTAQLFIFVAGGLGVVILAAADFWRLRDAGSLLLLCWILGVFIFSAVMNPFVAGRYLLPLVPAAAIVFARRLGALTGWRRYGMEAAGGCLLVLSLMVTTVDYKYANEIRSFTRRINLVWQENGGKLFFQGHWGMQYYLEQVGGVAFEQDKPQPLRNDLVITPKLNSNALELDKNSYLLAQLYCLSSTNWLSTFNTEVGAAFHSSLYGPLPFAFGNVPPDLFFLHRAVGRN